MKTPGKSVFEWRNEKLQDSMEKHWADGPHYRIYFDVLVLRHYEKILKETKVLAITTWVLAGSTIIAILIQLYLGFPAESLGPGARVNRLEKRLRCLRVQSLKNLVFLQGGASIAKDCQDCSQGKV